MTSKPVALMLADLSITKTHSRPHVSNDNPFSEAQFKTLKYRPEFPDRFGSIEDARAFCVGFFDWYNNEHYHSGLALLTPATVHYGGGPSGAHASPRHPRRSVRATSGAFRAPGASTRRTTKRCCEQVICPGL
jgi:hypothetical protein